MSYGLKFRAGKPINFSPKIVRDDRLPVGFFLGRCDCRFHFFYPSAEFFHLA